MLIGDKKVKEICIMWLKSHTSGTLNLKPLHTLILKLLQKNHPKQSKLTKKPAQKTAYKLEKKAFSHFLHIHTKAHRGPCKKQQIITFKKYHTTSSLSHKNQLERANQKREHKQTNNSNKQAGKREPLQTHRLNHTALSLNESQTSLE
jgi:hypothetical protein